MEEKKEISLEIRPEVAKGTYSNLAIITHSHSEFIIDFATILPGLPKPDISNLGGGQAQQGGTFNLGDLPQFGPNGAKS